VHNDILVLSNKFSFILLVDDFQFLQPSIRTCLLDKLVHAFSSNGSERDFVDTVDHFQSPCAEIRETQRDVREAEMQRTDCPNVRVEVTGHPKHLRKVKKWVLVFSPRHSENSFSTREKWLLHTVNASELTIVRSKLPGLVGFGPGSGRGSNQGSRRIAPETESSD
jgi:hypothetical protein